LKKSSKKLEKLPKILKKPQEIYISPQKSLMHLLKFSRPAKPAKSAKPSLDIGLTSISNNNHLQKHIKALFCLCKIVLVC
jgi:hypothetical protein